MTNISWQDHEHGPAPDESSYLTLPFAWAPSQRFGHGQVFEYRLVCDAGFVAVLRLVPDKGWAMTVGDGTAQPESDRGLFASPHDALMVLVAEFGASRGWFDGGRPNQQLTSP